LFTVHLSCSWAYVCPRDCCFKAQLPVGEKSVVFLRYFDGFSFKQIAEILQENINTIKSRLYRALQKLKAMLEGSCAQL
ncbi:MAG: RNA polymerase sigma factor, partial [Peptococcaceae bacterium]|nr:RNA polymerase sigma factor [Peptococcaceae bacterium]